MQMSKKSKNRKNDPIIVVRNFISNVLSSAQQNIEQNQIYKKVPQHLAKQTNSQIYQTFISINQVGQHKNIKTHSQSNTIRIKQAQKGFDKDISPSFIKVDNLARNTVNNKKEQQIRAKINIQKKNSSCISKNSEKKLNICSLRAQKLSNGCQTNYSTLRSIYSSKKDTFRKLGQKKSQIIPIFFAQQEQPNFQSKKRKQLASNQQQQKLQNQQNIKKILQFAIKSQKTKKIMETLQCRGKSLSYHYDGQILNVYQKQPVKQDQVRKTQLRKTQLRKTTDNLQRHQEDIKVIAKQVKYQIKGNQESRNQSQLNSFNSFDLSQFQQSQQKPKIFKKHSRISKTSRYGMEDDEVVFYNNYKRQTSCIPYTEISQGVKIQEKTAQDKQICIQKLKIPTQSREKYLNKTNQFSFRSYLPLESKSNSIMLDKTNKFDNQKVSNIDCRFKSQTLYVRPKTTENIKKIQKFKTLDQEFPKTQCKQRPNLQTWNKAQLKSYTERQFQVCKTSRIKSILWNQKRQRIIKKQNGKIWKNEQLYKTLQF